MAAFGDVLKGLRATANMTQAELSQKAGLSLGIVRDYEQCRKEPSLRSACQLADALGISVEAFRPHTEAKADDKPAPKRGRRKADDVEPRSAAKTKKRK
jgi:transcriptional regulator with XRE-family HTH domain